MPTHTRRTNPVTEIETIVARSYVSLTRAFESLLGRMQVDTRGDVLLQTPQAARERLESFVGPLDFTLFQKLDHGAVVATLTGRPCEATTYVFVNALIAVETTRHVPRAGLCFPLRLFVEAIGAERVRITYDLPLSLMAPFGSNEVNAVALGLDGKVERLLDETLKAAARRN